MGKKEFFKIRKSKRPKVKEVKKALVFAKPKSKDMSVLVKRAKRISEQLDQVKPLYHELDEITVALLAVKPGTLEKYGVVMVDLFADRNTQFRNVAMKRFELKWR